MAETLEVTRRRLGIRSMRRGIREMDLILSAFAEVALGDMGPEALAAYDRLLSENDHDLLAWITGQLAPPMPHAALIAQIAATAGRRA
jgi:antitoxin CptB